VTIEQLQHSRGLAKGAYPLGQPGAVERVDQPDAAVDPERVGRAPHALLGKPAEGIVALVNRQPLHAAP